MAIGKKLSWKKRLEAARTTGGFTLADQRDAGKWGSCAVGELKNIRRGNWGEPTSQVYDKLGMDFFYTVKNGWPFQATLIYQDIHKHYNKSRRSK